MADSDFRAVFIEEASELLERLEASLMALEAAPDAENLGAAFRALHTLKGSGAMFGFDAVAALAHQAEAVFDRLRSGELKVTPELVTLALEVADHLRLLIFEPGSADQARGEALSATLAPWVGGVLSAATAAAAPAAVGGQQVFRLRLRLPSDIYLCGGDPERLLSELRRLGTAVVVAQTDELPPLDAFDPLQCYAFWDVVLTTCASVEEVREVFMFFDDSALELSVLGAAEEAADESQRQAIARVLRERGDIDAATYAELLGGSTPQQLSAAGRLAPDRVCSAGAEVRQVQGAGATLRVRASRVDALVDLVGEMVTLQSRLGELAARLADEELRELAEQSERLVADLRDGALGVRMQPVSGLFARFQRLVRDLSAELGKQVELVLEGEQTEIDKSVLEALSEPMVHLVRNALDHGLEPAAQRQAAGKAAAGKLRLTARNDAAHVVIEVEDDGRGLDTEAIRAKAIEQGLISAEAHLAPEEVWDLIFAPGFSTAAAVTSVSGRGVGMDAVRRALTALRGSVSVRSRAGCGSVMTLRIPLSMAIIETLLVEISGQAFAVPLSLVRECVAFDEAVRSPLRRLFEVRGRLLSYLELPEMLGSTAVPDSQILVVEVAGEAFGLHVDAVLGEHDAVLKPLGHHLFLPGLLGATLLGDGSIALVFDVPQLVRHVVFSPPGALSASADGSLLPEGGV